MDGIWRYGNGELRVQRLGTYCGPKIALHFTGNEESLNGFNRAGGMIKITVVKISSCFV